nr:MAG TPA: hypothetical protein [Caudoviricetes sp.]
MIKKKVIRLNSNYFFVSTNFARQGKHKILYYR